MNNENVKSILQCLPSWQKPYSKFLYLLLLVISNIVVVLLVQNKSLNEISSIDTKSSLVHKNSSNVYDERFEAVFIIINRISNIVNCNSSSKQKLE